MLCNSYTEILLKLALESMCSVFSWVLKLELMRVDVRARNLIVQSRGKDVLSSQINQHSFLIIEETACNLHKGVIRGYGYINKLVYEKQTNYSLSFSASCVEAFYFSYNSTSSHFNEWFKAMKSELSINPGCRAKNGDIFRTYSRKK